MEEENTKPLTEIDALRLENMELKMRLLQTQFQSLYNESQVMIAEIARKDGVVGWQLELANKRWVMPPKLKPEPEPME